MLRMMIFPPAALWLVDIDTSCLASFFLFFFYVWPFFLSSLSPGDKKRTSNVGNRRVGTWLEGGMAHLNFFFYFKRTSSIQTHIPTIEANWESASRISIVQNWIIFPEFLFKKKTMFSFFFLFIYLNLLKTMAINQLEKKKRIPKSYRNINWI